MKSKRTVIISVIHMTAAEPTVDAATPIRFMGVRVKIKMSMFYLRS